MRREEGGIVDLGQVCTDIAAAIAKVEQAIRMVSEARGGIAEATAQVRVTTTASVHVKPAEALKLWEQAYEQADEALARLNEGKGHANAYLRSL
jgi:hypothetical protein